VTIDIVTFKFLHCLSIGMLNLVVLVQAKPGLIVTVCDDLSYADIDLNGKKVKSPNVLFIIADDLMKQVQLYGNDEIKTPHLNKLAETSTVFDRAYCQYPLCGPSRASLMLSKYPDNTGITFNKAGKSSKVHEKAKKMSMMTMPAYFRKHGYLSVGGGKIYHNNVQADAADFLVDFDVILKNAGRDGEKIKVKDGPTKNKTRITEKSDGGVFEHKD